MRSHASPSSGARQDRLLPYRISVGAALLVPLFLFAVISWQDYRITLRDNEKDVLRRTDIFYSHALDVVATNRMAAEAVNARIAGLSWDEIGRSRAIRDYLRRLSNEYPQVQAIRLADSTGRVRNASVPLPREGVSVADRSYFRALREADIGMYVGRIVTGSGIAEPNFSLATRRRGVSGAFDGVVAISVFPKYFSDFWNRALPKQGAIAALVRGDGTILARAPRLDLSRAQLPPASDAVREMRKASAGAYYGMSAYDRIEKYYAYRKLNGYNAYVFHGVSVAAVRSAWYKDLLLYAGLFGLSTAGLVTFSVTALRRAREEQLAAGRWRETAEEALRRSQADLNEAQRVGQIGSWDWDAVNDRIWWSDEYYRICGLTPGEPTPNYEEHLMAYTGESAQRLDAAVKQAMATGTPYGLDLELAAPTATTRWILARGEARRDATGKICGLRGTAQNITERKLVEMKLRESEEKFSAIYHATPDLVAVTRIADGTIIEANEAFERLLGYSRAEAVGKTTAELAIWADPADRATFVATLAKTGQIDEFETKLRRKDGSTITCIDSARVIDFGGEACVLSIVHDITGRKAAEEEIQRLNEDLEQRVKDRTAELAEKNEELERMNRLFVGRELRMVELKEKIRELEGMRGGPRQGNGA